MVAAHHLGQDEGVLHLVPQPVGDHEIVDAPTHVPGPGSRPVAPPGVGVGPVGVEEAEGVGKARLQKLGELAPFLIGKAGVADVLLGVFQVDLLVGHVHIAADDHGLCPVQLLQIGAEVVLPAHPVVQALQLVLGVGGVDADQEEVPIFQGHRPALGVMLRDAQVIAHGEGLAFGKDDRAGIALLFRVAPVALIAGEIQLDLPGLELGLLQADEIRLEAAENVLEALLLHGPQTVHVPGNEFHACSSLCPPVNCSLLI